MALFNYQGWALAVENHIPSHQISSELTELTDLLDDFLFD